MSVLVFQHMPGEDAGLFAEVMAADGVHFEVIEVQHNQPLPDPAGYEHLMVLGGAQQVWETDQYPWLAAEIDFIRHWVTKEKKPYFGLCLGHQMLAVALGGEVGLAEQGELGFPEVALLPGAQDHPMASLLPENSHWLQWHTAEVTQAPASLQVLASSANSAVQMMAGNDGVFSLQFHAEGIPRQIDRWTTNTSAGDSMRRDHGEDEVARVRREAEQHLPQAMELATQLFRSWMLKF